jgi:hypothetical protein
VPIVPDDKDWTWVLSRPCPECGFDASSLPAQSVAPLLRSNADAWQDVLRRPAASSGAVRPLIADRWSPLEYACHVRDVCLLYHERLVLMLREDDPLYRNWDQDATAVEERYLEQEPRVVAAELGEAAARLAALFDAVKGEQWQRRGRRSDGAAFTVAGFARYMVHDPVHHLYDVSGVRAG